MKSFWAFTVAVVLLSGLAPIGARAAEASWPRSLVLATASPGGSYYLYGQALSDVLSRSLGVDVTAQATQGPAQNIILVEEKKAALGMISSGIGLQGWNGREWAKGKPYRSIRVIFPMYDTQFHIAVPKKLGIRTFGELAGRKLGVGPRAGTGGTYVPIILGFLGVSIMLRNSSFEDMAAHVLTGDLDGIMVLSGVPLPAFVEIEQKEAVQYIPLSPQAIAHIKAALPEMTSSTIPANAYASLKEDYPTIGLYNFAIAHQDLPDDLVYEIVKAVFVNQANLIKVHSAARETVAENIVRNTILPVHPGAVRYYRERGIAVPDISTTN